jgi:NAD(P)-dependent dehydrogenase (short-subunit alcohol dehydrogenase family)
MTETGSAPQVPMSTEFAHRVALVVGASRGIGAETAREFARHGATVVLASRDEERLSSVVRAIRSEGGEAVAHRVDLADASTVTALGGAIREGFGRLDVAFNNAGEGARPTPLHELSPAEFERVIAVTVRGTFLALREEIPLMLPSGRGAIVNMSSTAGLSAFSGGAPYVAAKHAVLGLTKAAALDYAHRGIRVNAIAPGPIETDRIRSLSEPDRARITSAVPMRRTGRESEVARAVLWLCSDAASFVTGTTLTVDGGRLAGSA